MLSRLLCLFLAVARCASAAENKESFDAATQLPAGWQSGITGHGSAKWEVVADEGAPSKPNVLRQSGEATFAWAAKADATLKDGFVEVKLNGAARAFPRPRPMGTSASAASEKGAKRPRDWNAQ